MWVDFLRGKVHASFLAYLPNGQMPVTVSRPLTRSETERQLLTQNKKNGRTRLNSKFYPALLDFL